MSPGMGLSPFLEKVHETKEHRVRRRLWRLRLAGKRVPDARRCDVPGVPEGSPRFSRTENMRRVRFGILGEGRLAYQVMLTALCPAGQARFC